MTNYNLLKNKCKEVIDNNLLGSNMLNIKDFQDYFRILRSEDHLTFFKYFRPAGHSMNNLEGDVLVCNNPLTFNDVFEGMVTSLDINKAAEVRSIIDEICDSVSISCFSETWNNLLMYAHYADSFRGFCVEYDFTKIIKNYPFFYFFPVIYQSKPSSLAQMRQLREDVNDVKAAYHHGCVPTKKTDDIISYFIHKAEVWDYEREWRFIIPISQYKNYFGNSDLSKKIHLWRNFDCITSIYLAPNICLEDYNRIFEIIKNKNLAREKSGISKINLYQTKIAEQEYSLTRTLIND